MARNDAWQRPISRRTVMAAALTGVAGLTACTGGDKKVDDGAAKGSGITLALTPADSATDVAVSAEIGLTVSGGTVTSVELVGADGKKVDGGFRDDMSTWVPAEPLAYTTAYTATVTATADGGRSETATTRFTTMPRPGPRIEAHLYMSEGLTYGQAMPVVVEFRESIPEAARAAVERRLFVTSDPPQPGAWHWDSGIQVEYRPKEYWQPGTKIQVRLGLGGLPISANRHGAVDITANVTIDSAQRSIEVDNATKQLIAKENGQFVKNMPVSLGKPSTPSSAGTMVVMERLAKTTFDSATYGVPANSPDGYRTEVEWAMRLTYGGEFIHAAPWSVSSQGRVNVSHGCVNLSPDNAKWLFEWSRVGDPVVVKGTEERLKPGNGWTAWNHDWDEHVAGSALAGPEPTPS